MFHAVPFCRNAVRHTRFSGAPPVFFRFAVTITLFFLLAALCSGCAYVRPAPPPVRQAPPEVQQPVEEPPVLVEKKTVPEEKTAAAVEKQEKPETAAEKKPKCPCQPKIKRARKRIAASSQKTRGRLHVIGEVEPVTIREAGITLPARIDTGAETSSMGAADITPYERDGKKWVRFTIAYPDSGKTNVIEKPVSRKVKIKRHGGPSLRRYAVKFRVALGAVEQVREFTLVDRSAFKYPILIGRNFLDGVFIVDVSLKNSTSPFSEATDNER